MTYSIIYAIIFAHCFTAEYRINGGLLNVNNEYIMDRVWWTKW